MVIICSTFFMLCASPKQYLICVWLIDGHLLTLRSLIILFLLVFRYCVHMTAPPEDSGHTKTLSMTHISLDTCTSNFGHVLLFHVRLKT